MGAEPPTLTRRTVLAAAAAPFVAHADTKPNVVVIGGGFGGATAARRLASAANVTLLERDEVFVACPGSNAVIAGERGIEAQRFGYTGMAGVRVVRAAAIGVDSARRTVTTADGAQVPYDRLILSPGIDIVWGGLEGYDEGASSILPHAWKAGAQTLLLRRQLEQMDDGGVVVISAPAAPYRCPPAPYERASLIAWYLKRHKPRSKVLILDAKDSFSNRASFQAGWDRFYPGMIEWISLSDGGRVTRVDPATKTFETDMDSHRADVGCVVPPQRAGAIAAAAGVADRTGWCPIDPVTFESAQVPCVHIIGDAAQTSAVPKSASAAHAEGAICAAAVAALLRGDKPDETALTGACYSLVTPAFGLSVTGTFRPVDGVLTGADSLGSGTEDPETLARKGEAWFRDITADVFG